MDLNQLKTFVTVADEKHLTRAAERLHTSQPAISAQLKSLEDQLALKLFDRTPKGMQLTPAGSKLLIQAKQILAETDKLLSDAKSLQGAVMGNLTVGINSDYPFLKIPELLKRCREHHPDLHLSFAASMSAQIGNDIRQRKLDAGFFFGPCNPIDLSITKLADIQTAVVIPASWSGELCNASVEELAKVDWIYTTNLCPFYALKEEIFASSHIKPIQDLFVDTEEGIRELIKSESGISLLRLDDAEKAESEGWGKRWQGKTPNIDLNIAIHANKAADPVYCAFLALLVDSWRSNKPSTTKNVV